MVGHGRGAPLGLMTTFGVMADYAAGGAGLAAGAFDRARTLAAGYGPAEAFEEYGAGRRHGGDRLQDLVAGSQLNWKPASPPPPRPSAFGISALRGAGGDLAARVAGTK